MSENPAHKTDPSAPRRRARTSEITLHSERTITRMRLRHKLAVLVSLAALLPVVVVSWVAVSVVLRSLDKGVNDETERQLQVGLSLVLRNVERIGADAMRLASTGELTRSMRALAMVRDRDDQIPANLPDDNMDKSVQQVLDEIRGTLPSALVQVLDEDGQPVADRVIGNDRKRFYHLRVGPQSRQVHAGLRYESPLTIDEVEGVLVVRAASPILDPSYHLLGVLVISVPLDGPFTDEVKGALGSDVLIFAGSGDAVQPALSTFLNATGVREQGIEIAPRVAAQLDGDGSVLTSETIFGREYSVGYASLLNLEHKPIGILAVAVDRVPLTRAQTAATRSLALGAAGAFVFALGLAGLLTRRLSGPIARLHRGALAVARGDLDYQIKVSEGDEIGDLAAAFSLMTQALKENQVRLATRMREIVALHSAGRAVSSVIDLTGVMRTIVDSVARVFDVRLCAIWIVETPSERADRISGSHEILRLGAARIKPASDRETMHGGEFADPLTPLAIEVAASRMPLRIDWGDDDGDVSEHRASAAAVGVTGSLLATPLERKDNVVGVLVVGRERDAELFSDAAESLLATFADQAAAAVENARLYKEVREFNEELERKVKTRTAELTRINSELGRAITELRETQAQLIHSERMAGLGVLVAGVAHEINSPSAAIAGSVDALGDNVARLSSVAQRLSEVSMERAERERFVDLVSARGAELAGLPMISAAAVRRTARPLIGRLQELGISKEDAKLTARRVAELQMDEELASAMVELITHPDPAQATIRAQVLLGYMTEYVFLHRSALTIGNSVKRIQRIVGALKGYSHLDQEASFVDADLHEGIEDTLVILDYVLRDITVIRKFGELPRVRALIDELNQVWTNLIHNAVQALQGEGQITIETGCAERPGRPDWVFVRIIDNGPGIPANIVPRIFEPFFTTKPKGEGTGLGLGIVKQIVDQHRGEVSCESSPGHTCFEVRLPVGQPDVDAPVVEVPVAPSVGVDVGKVAP